jgi:uncharacterized protein (TIGR02271 family)
MMNMPYTDADPIIDWADRKYTLRDASGDKIGELVEVNPDYVIAETDGGFLGLGEHRRYYVPRSAVTERDGTDWYLSITKEQIESMDWREPPTASRFATDEWRQQAGVTKTTSAGADVGRTRLVRYEEELQAQKVSRQAGEVIVGKDVVEEVQSIEVPVRREEVHIERRPVTDQTATDAAFSTENETIRVPVMEEDVEVSKVVRPVEEVVVSKQQTEETREVRDTVRKERFEITDDQQRLRDPQGTDR